jgi:hypothetical protein
MRPCEGHSYRLEGRIDDVVSEWHPNLVNTCGRLLASGDFDACGLFLTFFPMDLVRLACWREHAEEANRKGLEGLDGRMIFMRFACLRRWDQYWARSKVVCGDEGFR